MKIGKVFSYGEIWYQKVNCSPNVNGFPNDAYPFLNTGWARPATTTRGEGALLYELHNLLVRCLVPMEQLLVVNLLEQPDEEVEQALLEFLGTPGDKKWSRAL